MTGLVRSELLKLRTTNVWWSMLLGVAAFTALALLFNYFQTDFIWNTNDTDQVPDDANQVQQDQQAQFDALRESASALASNMYTSGQFFGLLLAMIFGVLVVTNEFHHQTVTSTFLTTPRRERVIGAKVIVAALWGVVFFLVTALLAVPVGAWLLGVLNVPLSFGSGEVWGSLALNALAFAVWAVFGVGLGTLLKNQIVSVIVVLVLYIGQVLVSGILTVLAVQLDVSWLVKVQYWLPGGASQVMISTTDIPGIPPWWAGALTLLAYGVVAAVVGTALTIRRDVS